jgi:hypothetical protein
VVSNLAESLGIDRDEIMVVMVEAVTWTSGDLGCRASAQPNLDQAIEGYRLVLLVDDAVYEYHTDSGMTFHRCGSEGANVGETGLLADIDPIAGELVALGRRRVSQERGVPTTRVRVVEVTQYTWPDSSLGCPLSGEDYESVQIDGYRIVLSVGDETFIFHTDFDRLVPCDPGDETLPDAEGD